MDEAAPLNPYAYGCRHGASAWTELPVEEDIHEKKKWTSIMGARESNLRKGER